jgi:hypothetical protein
MNDIFPLERAAEAYEHMMSGKARFPAVRGWYWLHDVRRSDSNPESLER